MFLLQYVIVLLVILVFETAITIVAFALNADSVNEITTTMAESLQRYGSQREISQLWDNLHREVSNYQSSFSLLFKSPMSIV